MSYILMGIVLWPVRHWPVVALLQLALAAAKLLFPELLPWWAALSPLLILVLGLVLFAVLFGIADLNGNPFA